MMQIQKLEQIFSQDLQSSSFSILADFYYKKRLYSHAKKVCEIGLKYHPLDIEGKYILAKILLIKGEIKNAEFFLKDIILRNPYQLNAILLLIKTMEELNRSKKSIGRYIRIGSLFYKDNKEVKKYYKDSGKVKIKKNKAVKIHVNSTLHISHQLATKTMYKLLLTQKKYTDAYALLKIMNKQSKYKNFVNKEMKKIKNKQ